MHKECQYILDDIILWTVFRGKEQRTNSYIFFEGPTSGRQLTHLTFQRNRPIACSVGWFVSLLVREEILLADLYERKILFRLEIYDRLR